MGYIKKNNSSQTIADIAFQRPEYPYFGYRHSVGISLFSQKENKMITQYEVPVCLIEELPEIEKDLKLIYPSINVFKRIQCFANFTRNKVVVHDFKVVKKCFSTIENIYIKGDIAVKDAIKNVFVYSLSLIMQGCNRKERKQIHSMMPLTLYTAFFNQVLKSGI